MKINMFHVFIKIAAGLVNFLRIWSHKLVVDRFWPVGFLKLIQNRNGLCRQVDSKLTTEFSAKLK